MITDKNFTAPFCKGLQEEGWTLGDIKEVRNHLVAEWVRDGQSIFVPIPIESLDEVQYEKEGQWRLKEEDEIL